MAEVFDSVIATDIGSAEKVILNLPDRKAILLSCIFGNKTAYELPITVWIRRGTTNASIVKDWRVSSGQNSGDVLNGKMVLEAGDSLMARCPIDAAFDSIASIMTGIG